jgi:hypothetical protein
VKREYTARPRQQRAEQAEGKQARTQISADVNMYDFVTNLQEQAEHLDGVRRVIDAISIRLPVPCKINYTISYVSLQQKLPDCHQVGLNAAMWRRIRAELNDAHQSISILPYCASLKQQLPVTLHTVISWYESTPPQLAEYGVR